LHYLKTDWSQRKYLKVGEKNVQHPALAEWHRILLPFLHIKLSLVKNFVKAMDQTGSAFKYLAEKFPPLSEVKIKEGGFCGSSDLQALQRQYVQQPTSGQLKKAWDMFLLVSANFLGSIRA
jgi:hypothetical protein